MPVNPTSGTQYLTTASHAWAPYHEVSGLQKKVAILLGFWLRGKQAVAPRAGKWQHHVFSINIHSPGWIQTISLSCGPTKGIFLLGSSFSCFKLNPPKAPQAWGLPTTDIFLSNLPQKHLKKAPKPTRPFRGGQCLATATLSKGKGGCGTHFLSLWARPWPCWTPQESMETTHHFLPKNPTLLSGPFTGKNAKKRD